MQIDKKATDQIPTTTSGLHNLFLMWTKRKWQAGPSLARTKTKNVQNTNENGKENEIVKENENEILAQ